MEGDQCQEQSSIMRHIHNTTLMTEPLVIGAIILVFIIVIAGVVWLIHRKRVASDGLTPIERKKLDYPEREILSMLRQQGGPMMQSEIIDALPGDLEDLSGVMKSMQDRGFIQRQWRSDQKTFIVTAWSK